MYYNYFKITTFYQNFRLIFRNETEEGHSVQWKLGLNLSVLIFFLKGKWLASAIQKVMAPGIFGQFPEKK